MDKQTLSNYGWIVVCILVLCVMIALATPFGNFIASGVKSTAQGLFDVNQKAFNNVGFGQIPDQSIEDSYNGTSGERVIPTGGTYYTGVTTVQPDDYTGATATYVAGQEFPDTVNYGDVYVYGSYEYRYGAYFYCDPMVHWPEWNPSGDDGWGVCCINNVANPGAILTNINGKPITDMEATFYFCDSLTVAPVIPSSVTNTNFTFFACTSLVTAPVIPNGVTNMVDTFAFCESLTVAPAIPNGVTIMETAFYGCTSLTVAPVIPNSVTNMDRTFNGCTSLKTYAGSTGADGDFSGYVIPNSVTNMYGTFSGCTSLAVAPVIPSSVANMSYTFKGCTTLTGTITINATPTSYSQCFRNTQITEILGSCGNKSELLATK